MDASRAVWIIANGDPGEALVLHTCNGGSGANGCINIRHLCLGTPASNMRDRKVAGRHTKGTEVPQSRLTPDQIIAIRERMAGGGVYQRDLAQEYGVSQATISLVAARKRWAWLS